MNNNSTLNNNSGGTLINDDAALNNNCGSTFTNGGTVNSSGTIINCATSTVTITATGMISCTYNIMGGTVVNHGGIVVGCSPGIMEIDGNFITDGSLSMELGGLTAGTGTGFHDQLQVSGAVTFGGTLTVSLFGGFDPVPTNAFTLMTYGSRTGMTTFASLNIPCPSCWSLSYGATALVLTLNSALPVELTSFHARTDGSSVLLDWHTASELENKGFEIERSTDDRNWGTLGFVPGNGTTLEEQSYSFTDKFPLTGTNYYRLRQVDHDGKFEHSKVVAIDLTGLEDLSGLLRVFPNPVSQGELTLYFSIDLDETSAMLRLYSPTAQLLRKQPVATREAKLDMTGLPAGVYVVELVSDRKAWRERVLVQ